MKAFCIYLLLRPSRARNTIVKQVELQKNGAGVTVRTSRGMFSAKRCICTLPLGVLKSGTIEFAPGLPTAKLKAIERLAMGTLHKAWLSFPEPFWPDARVLETISERENHLPFTVVASDLMGGVPTLLVLHGGGEGARLEQLDERAFREEMTQKIRAIWLKAPAPLTVRGSNWSSDPFSRDSYSYLPVGASASDRDALAASVSGVLHFAGEATNKDARRLSLRTLRCQAHCIKRHTRTSRAPAITVRYPANV
jgi:polyamine oxidase